MNELETPLEHLFLYIRDIFSNSLNCYDFKKEQNNEKRKGVNYWQIDELNEISKNAKRKSIGEIEFALTTDVQVTETSFLTVRRVQMPPKPIIPEPLQEWTNLDETNIFRPQLFHKTQIERTEKFDGSVQRVKALESFKKNPTLLLPDVVPILLEGWLKYTNASEYYIIPEKSSTILFESDSKRVQSFKQFAEEFKNYYKLYEVPLQINALYDGLHKLYYDLKGRDSIKLHLSFGLVQGDIGKKSYANYLFHVPLKLSLKKQEIKVEYDTFRNKLFAEQNFLDLLDVQFSNEGPAAIEAKKKDVLKMLNEFNARQMQFFFEREFIRDSFYEPALDLLKVFAYKKDTFFVGEDLNLAFDHLPVANEINLSFSPVIQSKLAETNIEIANDANNIANKIYELKQLNQIDQIPDFFKKLFSMELPENTEVYGKANEKTDGSLKENSNFEPIKYLFPLPVNDEQQEIAKRLNEQDAVTVKGPPGTGKSHTIANLISHFVAQGKSILVVSHNAKALSVIKDKLPMGIQELAISLVNDGQGKESLKASVSSIIGNISNKYHDEKKVERSGAELVLLEKRYQEELSKIYSLIHSNSTPFEVFNPFTKIKEKKTGTQWAEYLFNSQSEEPLFISDDLHYMLETDNLTSKLLGLIECGRKLQPKDFALCKYDFINREEFISVEELRNIEDQINRICTDISPEYFSSVNYKLLDADFFDSLDRFTAKLDKVRIHTTSSALLSGRDFSYTELISLLENNKLLLDQLRFANQNLLDYTLDISPLSESNPFEQYDQINQLILKFGNNKTLSFVSRKLLNRQLSRFLECKVNYSEATTIERLKIVETEITKQKITAQLKITFANYYEQKNLGFVTNIFDAIDSLSNVASFVQELTEFNKVLQSKGLQILEFNAHDFQENVAFINNLFQYVQYQDCQKILRARAAKIKNHAKPHPLIEKIGDAIESTDRLVYEMYFAEYLERRDISVISKEYDALLISLYSHFPSTVGFIDNNLKTGKEIFVTKQKIEQDIFILKLRSFLQFILTDHSNNKRFFDELQFIKRNVEKKTAELIVAKAWLHKSEQTETKELSALNAWLNDLIKVGRGMGKNVSRDYASAISNMQIAKKAVPIWIMPLDSAITFFPECSPNQFDLLIIDEASQCDISSLNLIFRAKKALIVGDENQTSVVVDRSISIDKTNVLLNKYLYNHQFRTQFDVSSRVSSVYAMASVVYPNIVTLKEHFRCLPEIIGFSNQHIYSNAIIPLKTALDKMYGEPIEIHYVEDDISSDHKLKIVERISDDILKIIQDYENKKISRLPTIGIIALDSSNTTHIKELIHKIAEHKLVKYYEDELDFMVGTSREFQGDERDIIFLTITSAHRIVQEGEKISIKPPIAVTSEEYMRIFNVAASRAKEKSVLYHSIHPDAVPAINPECYRKKLIDYYSNYNHLENITVSNQLQDLLSRVDPNSGPFERSVCSFLYEKRVGNYLHPQYAVGRYVIDFGIIIQGKKLAIECDGYIYHSGFEKIRDDIKRQEILERAGWKFFRVQSTEWFYRNREVCRKLSIWLNDNVVLTAELLN